MDDRVKQVIVVRRDIARKLGYGKLASQVAHASMKTILDSMKTIEYNNETIRELVTPINSSLNKWLTGSFTKIVVGCKDEKELYDIQAICETSSVLNALIIDEGRTRFQTTCEICDGEGGEWAGFCADETYTSCSKCNGTGKINNPTATCIAVGPDFCDVIDEITSKYQLLF